MAGTERADIIVPAVFSEYVDNRTAELSALRQSGIIATDQVIQQRMNGGGHLVNIPFWNDLSGNDEVLSDSAALTPSNINAGEDIAVKLFRGRAWAANDLAGWVAGSDPMAAIGDRVAEYWARREQSALLSTLTGVFATGGALASSHVLSVHATSELTGDVILDGKQLLGDAGGKLTAIAMHSAKYTALQKANLIVYVRDSEAKLNFPTYLGYRVIIDDACPVETIVGTPNYNAYTSYLFGVGAIAGASMTMEADKAVETDRDSLAGDDILITRRTFIMHARGVKYNSATVNPDNGVLSTAASWAKVYDDKNIRVVKLVTK